MADVKGARRRVLRLLVRLPVYHGQTLPAWLDAAEGCRAIVTMAV